MVKKDKLSLSLLAYHLLLFTAFKSGCEVIEGAGHYSNAFLQKNFWSIENSKSDDDITFASADHQQHGFIVQAKEINPKRQLAGEQVVEIKSETYADSKSSVQDGLKCPDDVNSCYKLPTVEVLSGTNGDGYRGFQTQTQSGKTCQRWDRQWPNTHTHADKNCDWDESTNNARYYGNTGADIRCTKHAECRGNRVCSVTNGGVGTCSGSHGCTGSDTFATRGLGAHNYCRNPGNSQSSIWCYTDDGSAPGWELCNVKTSSVSDQYVARIDNKEFAATQIGSTQTLTLEECKKACYESDLCTETVGGTKDKDYRGCQAKTSSGKTCMAWDQQFPHIVTAQNSRCDWDETKNTGGNGKCTKYDNSCGWRKVRHIPASASAWFVVPNDDRLVGNEVWGDSTNDAASWGVKFNDDTNFDQYLF